MPYLKVQLINFSSLKGEVFHLNGKGRVCGVTVVRYSNIGRIDEGTKRNLREGLGLVGENKMQGFRACLQVV